MWGAINEGPLGVGNKIDFRGRLGPCEEVKMSIRWGGEKRVDVGD